ncbi:MAG: sulfur carrier protein ThiS [Ottowia sp.]|uniref:sulfur carrier protein ThiS n=1 Tax=Ottowia sp. TaxID=1898956 RepID=UPI003C71041F
MKDILIPDTSAEHTPAVTIHLDGQPRKVAQGSTLAQLVQALGHEEKAVSTAVNGAFVARTARGRVLTEGDAVLLFQPIVGG